MPNLTLVLAGRFLHELHRILIDSNFKIKFDECFYTLNCLECSLMVWLRLDVQPKQEQKYSYSELIREFVI